MNILVDSHGFIRIGLNDLLLQIIRGLQLNQRSSEVAESFLDYPKRYSSTPPHKSSGPCKEVALITQLNSGKARLQFPAQSQDSNNYLRKGHIVMLR